MQLSKKMEAIKPSLTLKISAEAARMKASGQDVVSFGAGEPDFETPLYIREAAKRAIDEGRTKYTAASGITELKQAACDKYFAKYGLKYTPANAVISNGAKHSLYNIMQVLLNPGDEVIIITPFWLSYSELVKMADGVPVFVNTREEDGYMPKVSDIEAAVTDKTKAIVINSPSNPTGAVYGRGLLCEIAEVCKKHDILIISDEIYDELIYGVKQTSIACVSEDAKSRTLVVNDMSKAYAMTGWRIGYVLCDERIAAVMSAVQSNSTSNPCSIAQYASVAALSNGEKDIAEMRAVFEKRRDLICSLADGISGVSYARPYGAFYILLDIKALIGRKCAGAEISSDVRFAELLLKEKLVAVIPGEPFGAPDYVRLSYACSEENITKGLERIKEFCASLE